MPRVQKKECSGHGATPKCTGGEHEYIITQKNYECLLLFGAARGSPTPKGDPQLLPTATRICRLPVAASCEQPLPYTTYA